MAFDPITAIANVVNTVIDRLLPDKTQAAQAKADLLEMQVKGELDNAIAQLQVDAAEAQNKSLFVAGWRPFVGWACGIAFVYSFMLQPLIITILVACKVNFDASKLPALNLGQMITVLLGMLGMGAMRSVDKANGNGND